MIKQNEDGVLILRSSSQDLEPSKPQAKFDQREILYCTFISDIK